MEQVFTLDSVACSADVDPLACRCGDTFVPRFVQATVTLDSMDARCRPMSEAQLKVGRTMLRRMLMRQSESAT